MKKKFKAMDKRVIALEKALADKTDTLEKVEKQLKQHEEALQQEPATEGLEIAKNLNTICLVSWLCFGLTGKIRSRLNIDLDEKLKGKKKESVMNIFIPFCFLKLLPLLIVFFDIVLLVGLVDQGYAIKRFIDGDGVFQPKSWRFFDESVLHMNVQEFEEQIIRSRNPEDVANCSANRFTGLADFDRAQPNASHLFWLNFYGINESTWMTPDFYYSEAFESMYWSAADSMEWMFATCMPWEYAGLCAKIMKANIDFENLVQQGLDEEKYYEAFWEYPYACYLDCQDDHDFCDSMIYDDQTPQNIPQVLFSQNDWAGVALPRTEIESYAQMQQFPLNLSDKVQTVLWLLSTRESNQKSHDPVDSNTLHLYEKTQFVYWLGSGEAYLVEMIAIVVLSALLYMKAFLGEVRQLLHQIELLLQVSFRESAPGSLGTTACMDWPPSRLAVVAELLAIDLLTDVFLSLRFLFIAYMVLASAMIITWDHGVFAVLMSCLAMEFLFCIDDEIYEVLSSMGFEDSLIFRNRLLPALKAFARINSLPAEPVDQKTGNDGEPAPPASPTAAPAQPAVGVGMQRSEIFNAGAVMLTAGLFILHCIQSLQIATNQPLFHYSDDSNGEDLNLRVMPKDPNAPAFFFQVMFEEDRFRRIALITTGIFAAAFLIAAAMHWSRCRLKVYTISTLWAWPLLRLLQTGLCLVAVYSLIINCVYYGMLAWYKDASSPERVGAWVANRIFSEEEQSFWTAVALHSFISFWRAIPRSAPPSAASHAPGAAKTISPC